MKVCSILEDRDFYGRGISLNYMNRESFKTKVGGLISLLSYALIIANLVAIVGSFVNRDKQVEGTQAIKVDLFDDEEHQMSSYNLRFMLGTT